jgi:phospholipid/cholesterol/gamma-HCH transport system permease protein
MEGVLDRTAVPEARRAAFAALKRCRGDRLVLRLALERIDTAGAGLLTVVYKRAARTGTRVSVTEVSPQVRASLEHMRFVEPPALDGERRPLVERVGAAGYARWESFYDFLSLAADTFIWCFGGEPRTRRVRRGAVWTEANRIGVDAIGIVGLIAFLVGTVVALQSAYQLRQFGADIFVANLIGVSMTREMGPLMTAIIIAGRSGAAIAAEIATMSVNEEIDALRTMGLAPRRYIVVPKFQGITLTMPGLTVYANLLGIFGGFLVALVYMDMGAATFLTQLHGSLVLKDILTGLLKSIVFAWIIVLIAAHHGSRAYGGAESVGLVTTTSVVSSIFWVIVADAAFNLIFYF